MPRRHRRSRIWDGAGVLATALVFVVALLAKADLALAMGLALVPALWTIFRRSVRRIWRRVFGGSSARAWGRYYSD